MIKTTNKTMYDLSLDKNDDEKLKKMQEFADNLTSDLYKKYNEKNKKKGVRKNDKRN